MTGLLIIQIAGQFVFKNSMKELFGLFIALQLVCYLNGYNISLTSNAQIYTDEITKLVEFDLFNPEKLVQRFYSKDFNLLKAIRGRGIRYMTLHDDQEASIFKDLKTLALIIFVFVIVVFVMFMFVAFSEKYKERVKRML
jgi:hypothetical protein